jgi:hypothetical protein
MWTILRGNVEKRRQNREEDKGKERMEDERFQYFNKPVMFLKIVICNTQCAYQVLPYDI